MRQIWTKIIALLCCLATAIPASAVQPLSDKAGFSLLTCSPGEQVYELFGHSALRVTDDSLGIDMVFNYGVFSFYTENFILKFVSGQTDYTIGISRFNDFCIEYAARGSSVKESRLNLDNTEKQALWEFLNRNLRPENRIYRYNFIFNNCATKIRDAVEECTRGDIAYQELEEEPLTFRQAIRLYTRTAEWSQFGFDICLGAGTDRPAGTRELAFLPELMDEAFISATVAHPSGEKPLVSKHEEIVQAAAVYEAAKLSPMVVCCCVFAIALVISFLQIRYKWNPLWFDAVLYGITAIAGFIILYLMIFSEHPFTGANFNILWINPLWLVPLFTDKHCPRFSRIYRMAACGIIVLTILLSPAIPQSFNTAFFPLMATIALRMGTGIFAMH